MLFLVNIEIIIPVILHEYRLMNFLPKFPLAIGQLELFGIILVLGLIGGELAVRIRLPKITGYFIIGFLIGPGGLNVVKETTLTNLNVIANISLALLLFNAGRYLDFKWLRYDKGLLLSAIADSALTFLFTYVALIAFGYSHLTAALASAITINTSWAVLMMVSKDLSSEGPVTRRTLILASINTVISLIIFSLLLPVSGEKSNLVYLISLHACYRLLGSFLLGILTFILIKCLSKLIGKNKESQFILFISLIIIALNLSQSLQVSAMITLFIFGVCVRNFDFKNTLMEVDLTFLTYILLIPLFVISGCYLQLKWIPQISLIVITIIALRLLAKIIALLSFAKISNITYKQAISIAFALMPMAGVTISMSIRLIDYSPGIGNQIMLIISGVLTVLYVVGPIITQLAFIKNKETLMDKIKMTDLK